MENYPERIQKIKSILNEGLNNWEKKNKTQKELADKIKILSVFDFNRMKNFENDSIPNYFEMRELEKVLNIDFSEVYPAKDPQILDFIFFRLRNRHSISDISKIVQSNEELISEIETFNLYDDLNEEQKNIIHKYIAEYKNYNPKTVTEILFHHLIDNDITNEKTIRRLISITVQDYINYYHGTKDLNVRKFIKLVKEYHIDVCSLYRDID